MFDSRKLLSATLGAAALAAAGPALAGVDTAVCSIAVEYRHNDTLLNTYRKDFAVQEGLPYVDDFSTFTRFRIFSAIATRSNGDLQVSIDYFNDVGVFVSIGFDTSLVVRGGGVGSSTSGNHSNYASTGGTPTSINGHHKTSYTLSCRKA